MLAPNLIIIWPSTHASIPSGFARETTLDGLYPKGAAAAANPNTTGGAATHSHTSPTHNHSISSHTHTGTFNNANHNNGATSDYTDSGSPLRNGTHTHSFSLSTVSSESVSSEAVTYSAFSNDPPYLEVIFIKANGYQGIPDDAVLYLNGDSIPAGFANYAALHNKYAKGAATGQDAGATGGSLTNTHTIAHTHSTSHSHSGNSGNNNTDDGSRAGHLFDNKDGCGGHSHPTTLNSANVTSSSNSAITSQAESVEPAYTKLRPIQNTSGSSKLAQKKMIAMYLGTLANIPAGWKLCDGANGTVDMRGRYVKTSTTDAETGLTGGSDTHSHAAQSHTHTLSSHSHTVSVGGASDENHGRGRGGGVAAGYWVHDVTHTSPDSSATTANMTSANTTADSANNEPSHRTVLFLEFDFMIGGGGLLALL